MSIAALAITLATQFVPALIGVLTAFGWFVVRGSRPDLQESKFSHWWGGLAAVALLALPSVGAGLLTVFGLLRVGSVTQHLPILLFNSLLPQFIPLAFGLTIVLFCFFQREEPFRRHFAASVLVGFLARELVYVTFALLYLILAVTGIVPFS